MDEVEGRIHWIGVIGLGWWQLEFRSGQLAMPLPSSSLNYTAVLYGPKVTA